MAMEKQNTSLKNPGGNASEQVNRMQMIAEWVEQVNEYSSGATKDSLSTHDSLSSEITNTSDRDRQSKGALSLEEESKNKAREMHQRKRSWLPKNHGMLLTSFPTPELFDDGPPASGNSVLADSLFQALFKEVSDDFGTGPGVMYLEQHKDLMEALKFKFALREAMNSYICGDNESDCGDHQLLDSRHHTNRANILQTEFESDPVPDLKDIWEDCKANLS